MKLTNSTLLSTGTNSYGVYTANAGATTLTNDSVTITTTGGANAGPGVQSAAGGSTAIDGGSVDHQRGQFDRGLCNRRGLFGHDPERRRHFDDRRWQHGGEANSGGLVT